MAWGLLFAIESRLRRSPFSRPSSASGNLGLRTTSARSFAASGPNSDRTSAPTSVRSSVTLTLISPPMSADCWAICEAERVAVPWVSMSPIRFPSQTWFAASSMLPVRTDRRRVTFGTVPYGTNVTPIPLSSVIFRGFGTWKSFGFPGAGGVCFSASKGQLAASARTKAMRRVLFIEVLPSFLSRSFPRASLRLSARASSRPSRR